jgi:hypothetical protein
MSYDQASSDETCGLEGERRRLHDAAMQCRPGSGEYTGAYLQNAHRSDRHPRSSCVARRKSGSDLIRKEGFPG